MSDNFSLGLKAVLDKIDSAPSSNRNEEYKDILLKPEDGVKYKCRILTEQEGFVVFKEHNFVPVWFTKRDGSQVPGYLSFFAKEFKSSSDFSNSLRA